MRIGVLHVEILRSTRRLLLMLILFPAFICRNAAFADQLSDNICESEMLRAAHEHAIPVAILYAIGLTETGEKGILHAYAMNVDGHPLFSASLQEALIQFSEARRKGAKFIDVGCMQINYRFHGEHFHSLEDMFDPHHNVAYAARFLNSLRAREGNWTAAVARYHAGPQNQRAQRSYVCSVIANMIASGFGSWTSESASYCHR